MRRKSMNQKLMQKTFLEIYKKQTMEDALKKKVNLQHKSLMELKSDFTTNLESLEKKYFVNADV